MSMFSQSPGHWTHYLNRKGEKSTYSRHVSVLTPSPEGRGLYTDGDGMKNNLVSLSSWDRRMTWSPSIQHKSQHIIWAVCQILEPAVALRILSLFGQIVCVQIYSLIIVSRPLIKYFDIIELISQSDGLFSHQGIKYKFPPHYSLVLSVPLSVEFFLREGGLREGGTKVG